MNTPARAMLNAARLVLSGALLGTAIVGLFTHATTYIVIGAVAGGVAVLVAKAKRFI